MTFLSGADSGNRESDMKTPQDVFDAIPALQRQGLDPVRIAVRLVDISLENDEATRQIQTTHGYAGGLDDRIEVSRRGRRDLFRRCGVALSSPPQCGITWCRHRIYQATPHSPEQRLAVLRPG